MKVIIVSPSLDPKTTVSGISSVVSFIISNARNVEFRHFEIGRRDDEAGVLKRAKRVLVTLSSWKRLLESDKNSVIHYNLPLMPLAVMRDWFFIRHAMKLRRKVILHVHGGSLLFSDRVPALLERMIRSVLSSGTPVICLSDAESERLKSKYGCQPVYVMPNCPDISGYVQRTEHHSPVTIGYLGRIDEDKGMGVLLEACKMMKGESFRLCIAGKQPTGLDYLEKFTEELGDAFSFSGVVSGMEKNDFIKGLDIFVLPSFYEGLPMSLLECMGHGVVPVTTPVGSIGTVVRDGVEGMLVGAGDARGLADALMTLLKDSETIAVMSTRSRDRIMEIFNPETYVSSLEAIYKSLD